MSGSPLSPSARRVVPFMTEPLSGGFEYLGPVSDERENCSPERSLTAKAVCVTRTL